MQKQQHLNGRSADLRYRPHRVEFKFISVAFKHPQHSTKNRRQI